MYTTRLSSKGQIILPKAVRDARHWTSGTAFSMELVDDGVLLRPVKPQRTTRLEDVAGSLRVKGPVRSVAEMDQTILAEARRRRDRGRY